MLQQQQIRSHSPTQPFCTDEVGEASILYHPVSRGPLQTASQPVRPSDLHGHSLSLSVCLSVCLTLSVPVFLSVTLFVSLALSLSISPSLSPSVSLLCLYPKLNNHSEDDVRGATWRVPREGHSSTWSTILLLPATSSRSSRGIFTTTADR